MVGNRTHFEMTQSPSHSEDPREQIQSPGSFKGSFAVPAPPRRGSPLRISVLPLASLLTWLVAIAGSSLGQVTSQVTTQVPAQTSPSLPNSSAGNTDNLTPVRQEDNRLRNAEPISTPLNDGLLPEERVSIGVYEKCNRSVVHISTRSIAMDSFLQVKMREGGGSGSVLDKQGTLLTNQHVIDGAREITVSLFNGLAYSARVVGQDPDTDIAILRIDAPADQLIPIEWGSSQGLRVGQRIYAIGNPFGLERTMSTGMISSLNRQIPSRERRTMFSLIQIDASINQGNSGGPLFNTRGQLIGMNTAIMSSDGDSAGVGFAIPSSTVARIAPQLMEHGRVIRPVIGIRRLYENDQGLLIVDLTPGGPASQAGLQGFRLVTKRYRQGSYEFSPTILDTSQADLIIGVDQKTVSTADELWSHIESKRPGDQVNLVIIRDGQQIIVPVTLAASK
ncbi:MAG: S1C family serine protease [Pirellulaceae bacterium]